MNNLRFAILTLLLGSFVVSQVSAQTSPSPTPVVVPLAQAIEGLEGHRSSAARKLGHYGTVHILLRNGADGKVIDASISESSGSDILDSGALTAIRKLTFEPKKDSSGKLIEFSGIVAVEFNISVEALLGYYTCEQANLDADWYLNTFPKATASDLEVFKSAQFLLFISDQKKEKLPPKPEKFQVAWDKAISACRTSPTTRFLKALVDAGARG